MGPARKFATKTKARPKARPKTKLDGARRPKARPARSGKTQKAPVPVVAVAGELRGFQRTHLRGLAHGLKPVVQVGAECMTPGGVKAIEQALADHELIKVRWHQPEDKRTSAQELAAASDAHLCGLIGHMVILYRQHPTRPRLVLPQRRDAKPRVAKRRDATTTDD